VEKCCIAGEATGDNITWHMPFAYRITKSTNSNSEYVILIAFSLQHWLLERASGVLFTYIDCLVKCLSSAF